MTRLDIAQDVESISLVTSQRALVNRSIQHALERVFCYHDFPYYIVDKGVISTVATYSTGTVTVTQGSPTVTGSSTVWTSAMVGRKLRVQGQNAYYRILSINTGTQVITLEQNFQGASGSNQTYTIYKDEYRLNADVDKYKMLRQAQNNVPVFSLHPTDFDQSYPMPQSYSDPNFEIMEGTNNDTYSTGTVSATSGSYTITGSGTNWTSVEGLGRMSKITLPNSGSTRQVATIKSVDSDTQLTVFEDITVNVVAGSSYLITLNNLRVQLYQIPDSNRLIYYRYFRIPDILDNDFDIPDMPHNWHWLLMYGALSIILLYKGDLSKSQQEAEARFINGLEQMKMKIGSFTPDRIYKRKSIDRVQRRLDGLESPKFDRRYSS